MAEIAATEYVVSGFTHTLGVEDLTYPPAFDTEDEAYEWIGLRATRLSNDKWELSWFLARFAPADNEYGEQRLKRASARIGINAATAGRWRWMGSVWTLDVVKRFERLQHTHYGPATKVMSEAILRRDKAKVQKILDIMRRANEGKEDDWGDPTPRSVTWVKQTIQREIEGIEPKSTEDGDTAALINGHLIHEHMMDEQGEWHYVTGVEHPNEATWVEVQSKLIERALMGQYVSVLIQIEANE